MPHTKFQVEVLTPEGEMFNEEVEMVSTRTTLGEIGILANHEPVLATLEPTELRLYRSDTEIVRFAQSEGYLQVGGNHAMLLVQEAITPGPARRRRAARAAGGGRARARGRRRGQRAAASGAAQPAPLAGVPKDRRKLVGLPETFHPKLLVRLTTGLCPQSLAWRCHATALASLASGPRTSPFRAERSRETH